MVIPSLLFEFNGRHSEQSLDCYKMHVLCSVKVMLKVQLQRCQVFYTHFFYISCALLCGVVRCFSIYSQV